MTLKQFKAELRLLDIKYDPWGTSMEAFFECAGRMNRRKLPIPAEWQYKPGLGTDGTDKESYWHSLFGRCGNKQLATIGNYLHRLTSALQKAGRSY